MQVEGYESGRHTDQSTTIAVSNPLSPLLFIQQCSCCVYTCMEYFWSRECRRKILNISTVHNTQLRSRLHHSSLLRLSQMLKHRFVKTFNGRFPLLCLPQLSLQIKLRFHTRCKVPFYRIITGSSQFIFKFPHRKGKSSIEFTSSFSLKIQFLYLIEASSPALLLSEIFASSISDGFKFQASNPSKKILIFTFHRYIPSPVSTSFPKFSDSKASNVRIRSIQEFYIFCEIRRNYS